jgi:hypothetical protein
MSENPAATPLPPHRFLLTRTPALRLRRTPDCAQGIRVNDDLRDKKEFRNPGILELLMDKYHIRETGSVCHHPVCTPLVCARVPAAVPRPAAPPPILTCEPADATPRPSAAHPPRPAPPPRAPLPVRQEQLPPGGLQPQRVSRRPLRPSERTARAAQRRPATSPPSTHPPPPPAASSCCRLGSAGSAAAAAAAPAPQPRASCGSNAGGWGPRWRALVLVERLSGPRAAASGAECGGVGGGWPEALHARPPPPAHPPAALSPADPRAR